MKDVVMVLAGVQDHIRDLQDRIEELETDNDIMRNVLQSCLEDYGHPMFTDRHGMANRIRNALGKDPK